jgi:hypothetical protein
MPMHDRWMPGPPGCSCRQRSLLPFGMRTSAALLDSAGCCTEPRCTWVCTPMRLPAVAKVLCPYKDFLRYSLQPRLLVSPPVGLNNCGNTWCGRLVAHGRLSSSTARCSLPLVPRAEPLSQAHCSVVVVVVVGKSLDQLSSRCMPCACITRVFLPGAKHQ